ncbi:Stk1 family PASTA domain-containing Ser/Thr kinase [Streptomyces pathocidini]|uniref:non-specific serine/threonine protein kinase n=1 Tax=Streptomyces pathocidini TaxID=1650571 RepID=A0ABW7UYB4_9ACTN|nr:Stk1 family PASTA domain-containing Ser/Thr kinase [Streptomyces pathocidini]
MDTTLDPLLGHVLDGRYRVDARIAVGGMATVYRAVDTRLDRVLALKVMHPGLASDAAFVDRFIHEAKSVARLAHPNVVGVYDQGTDGTYVYLAMEYVAGCTLRDVLRERGALRPRAALDILEPVLAALGAAHRAGLVHRDMKPENVLIGDDGRVKVADFGLVRAVDTNTTASSGSLLGTVSYLAPEQIEHGTADTRADVYACGVVLHEMLTGAKPHDGGTPAQVLYQHLHEDVAPPSRVAPGVAPALDDLVVSATARDPRLRPADAVALLAAAREARASLTDGQLDAVPPSALPDRGTAGSEDRTSVIPRPVPSRAAAEDALNRTSILAMPPQEPPAGPAPTRAGRRPPRRGVLALVAALLLVFGVGASVWYINSGQFTRVPGVLRLPQQEAERKLAAAGLDVRAEQEHSDVVPRGQVIETDPGRGARIRGNGTVTIVVSQGPEVVKVPDLEGRPLSKARDELRNAGLTPGTVTWVFSDKVAQGSVLRTEPGAGIKRKPGTAVAVVVSKGEPVEAPDVTGDSPGEATRKLREAGLKVEVETERVFSEQEKNTVAEQSPGGDTPLARGDKVTLTLSKGPEMVEVPDVEGKSADEAEEELRAAGFDVEVSRFFFGDTVWDQSVDGGEKAPKGSTVTIRVR